MGKSRRHPQLAIIVFSQLHSDPAAKIWRRPADIHRHIKYRPAHHSHQFALGLTNLIVQSAQHTLGRAAMIVLNEADVKPGDTAKIPVVEAFEEEAPTVAEYPWLYNEYFRD